MGSFIEFNEIPIRIYDQDTIGGLLEYSTTELLSFIKIIISFSFLFYGMFFHFIRILITGSSSSLWIPHDWPMPRAV